MGKPRHRLNWIRSAWRGGVFLAGLAGVVALSGCDAFLTADGGADATRQASAGCQEAPTPERASTLVVLDWDGGESMLVRDTVLGPFCVKSLSVAGEAPDDQGFRDAVLFRVRTMLCVLRPLDVAVIDGEADAHPYDTVVHITSDLPAVEGRHIGQSTFDPCNEYDDDAVVIWGGALAARIPTSSADAWVNAFANSIVHEIGHTLGFFHPDDVQLTLLDNPGQEVMRARVEPSDLLGEQGFVIRQETCPGRAPGLGSYNVVNGIGCGSVGGASDCPALTIGDTRPVELR